MHAGELSFRVTTHCLQRWRERFGQTCTPQELDAHIRYKCRKATRGERRRWKVWEDTTVLVDDERDAVFFFSKAREADYLVATTVIHAGGLQFRGGRLNPRELVHKPRKDGKRREGVRRLRP
jgi:hypothetical protein